ncbi:MAG TPA: nucleotide-binding protein [Thermoanaerobaculia bacterium]
MTKILLTLASVVLIAGCGAESDRPAASAPPAQPKGNVPGVSASASQLTGKVVETYDAGGYTYVKVDAGGEPRWAAVAQTDVKRGETVTINAQMTVDDFESKTLGRKFDRIIFGTITGGEASRQMPPGHPDTGGATGSSSTMGNAAQHMAGPADGGDVAVPKAVGPNAMTIAQVWAGKPADQPVLVRGKVVKFLSGIMGKNWLHIRDGSGSAGKGDHDLTVTTQEVATVGDVVVVSGIVRVDKDFGAGYRYPVIIEDAKLSK